MRRLPPSALVILILGILTAGSASATTYYIAANGSDSNNGTSKTTPWLHAPGMTGCSATCASTSPNPGDSFILRGGDTWHYNSTAGSPVGMKWNWNWSGSSTNCQLNPHAGTVVTTSCIYVGVDQTWYSGSSWTRPILNMDNPPTNSLPGSCANNQSGVNLIATGGASYFIFDNFEITGWCWIGNAGSVFNSQGNQIQISNIYFHGWSTNNVTDSFGAIQGDIPFASYQRCNNNVFDGSDASEGNVANKATGMSIYNACTEIDHNIFSHVSNGCICSPLYVHDNLFQYLYEPNDSGTHGNIVEWNNPNLTSAMAPKGVSFYNNIMHDTNEGEGINLAVVSAHAYVFNNVSWLYRENSDGTNGSDGSNCYQPYATSSTSLTFFNNTTDYPCGYSWYGSYPSSTGQNNHFIGFSVTTFTEWVNPGPPTTDNGNEIFQSESTANGQGYSRSNSYATTSGSGATVGAGANLASLCNGLDTAAAAACNAGAGTIMYDTTNHAGVFTAGSARPASGAWDAGAYEFGSGSAAPNPPTGLVVVVQ